ncbi:hypothetical protein ACN4EG_04875 [Alkalinema pantanalense CENA528]|uniref:hypothetical protein n=1 Tax=Alkalinema pantanalense TaxID=1620705 RepID=UPI003D6F91DD
MLLLGCIYPVPRAMDAFSDNWAYLKVELNWLERLLMMAVAKQRQEAKELDAIAKTRGDRATSHWWKGVITVEKGGYDSPRPVVAKSVTVGNYHEQLETRVQASAKEGIPLALPQLCDRLALSRFEKQVLLLALAPEVHHRYSDLLDYLCQQSLPTVDLALRLFCRSDQAWREGRLKFLTAPFQLLIQLLEEKPGPLLKRSIKLSDDLVTFLLSDVPELGFIETLQPIAPPIEIPPIEPSVVTVPLPAIERLPIERLPIVRERERVWRQAVPKDLPRVKNLSWKRLAQLELSSTEIQSICQRAIEQAQKDGKPLSLRHFKQVLQQQGLVI